MDRRQRQMYIRDWDKPMFRKCLEQRRCVIPSTGFYEWAADKTKYRFRLPGEDALYMAGLYNEFAGEPRYVILTTAANESIADVHNRMPVVLPRARIAEWIGGLGAPVGILRAVPPLPPIHISEPTRLSKKSYAVFCLKKKKKKVKNI